MILSGSFVPLKDANLDEIQAEFGDATGFALQLLSKIYSQTERRQKAILAERKALKLNPFLWKSYESLCDKGDAPDPHKVFTTNGLDNFSHCHGNNTIISLVNQQVSHPVTAPSVPATATLAQPNIFSTPIPNMGGGMNETLGTPNPPPPPMMITPSSAAPVGSISSTMDVDSSMASSVL